MDLLSQAFKYAFEQYATNCAIEVDKESITYAELKIKSETLANLLSQNLTQENSIILFGARSLEVYVSIVACVLANYTYVPLNPKFPTERLKMMIERTKSKAMLLCQECVKSFCSIADSIKPLTILCYGIDSTKLQEQFLQHNFLEIPLEVPQHMDFIIPKSTNSATALNPAYLLFTSGSTGIPKGVLVSRSNLISYVNRIKDLYHFTKKDRISQFFDLTFDLSMHDIFCTLLSGATLVVIPQIWLLNPLKFITKNNLSVLFAPPSLIAYLHNLKALKENSLPNLRIALFCGEALPVKSAMIFAKAAPNASLDNLYGPTEATISFTHYRFIEGGGIKNKIPLLQEDILPLGLPFKGLIVSLRDSGNKEVKHGEIGEILLGSEAEETSQIALGYYNDPSKTQEKFIKENGIRWYKTGDLGKFDPALNAYCFLGRIDEQVKIQGFRVELLEIDNALSVASNQQARAILIKENDLDVLYGVIEDRQIDSKQILNTLHQKLPHYMLPKQIFCLENFPLNSNGKVDRNAIKQWLIHQIAPPPSNNGFLDYGQEMYTLAQRLFKIPRSLSGKGNRKTLQILKDSLKTAELKICAIPTGTKAFDWEIPKEWNVKDAYILTPDGEKICDFHTNNLHLVGYSIPTHTQLTFKELKKHLHYLQNQPQAIPYITSYYKEYFGFCLSFEDFKTLQDNYENSQEPFKVVVDSTLENGVMNYGEIKIQGKNKQEVLLSTYICHPQMANNELSGILLCHTLAKILSQRENRYSYRILFLPETLGSIYYLSQHLQELKKSCIAGFVLTCIGDNGEYSVLHSKSANNLADRAAKHILKHFYKNHKEYSYLERGSDERQYCAPGVELPFCTLMRTKFGKYKEYHTSLDNLSLFSATSLANSLEYVLRVLEAVELNDVYKNTILCEPKLSKYDLYPTLSTKETFAAIKDMRNLLMYCDGKLDLLEIAEICDFNLLELKEPLQKFITKGLLKNVKR